MGLPKTAIVVFNHGAFGGAAKRYTHLFSYLDKNFPGSFYYVVNNHLFSQIKSIFPDINLENIKIVDLKPREANESPQNQEKTRYYSDHVEDPLITHKNANYPRKVYWYYKNLFRQKKLFRQVERLRKELDIKAFIGVFGGVVPLTFYMNEEPRRAAVIFSDMDSWFTDVHSDMKKLWYRKYYSFNYALENAGAVDFLSPYILEGIHKIGIKIDESRAFVAPCSFIDYSKCSIGSKPDFEIAFAARLEPDKNPMMFLEAAKIIHSEFPAVKFRLLGEGTLVYKIENYIKDHILSDAVDFRFHNNPPEVFANTRVFVSLQSNTNYPSQSVLEAMACGNAVIASNTGDTKLFINNKNGILINLNTNELVAALRKLVVNKETTRALGLYAAGFAKENHTIEKYVEYYMGLINRVSKY